MARKAADGEPLLDKAKGAAQKVLFSLPEGGNVAVVGMSGVAAPKFSLDRRGASSDIGALRVTPSPSRAIEAALSGIGSMGAGGAVGVAGQAADQGRRKEVFFVTDLCKNSFGGDLRDIASAIRRPGQTRIRRTADGGVSSVYVIDVGEASTANVAVRAVRISRPTVSIEMPLRIAVEVVNYGKKRVKDVAVQLQIEDKPVGKHGKDAAKISLEPGELRMLEFPYTPYRSGVLTGEAWVVAAENNAVEWDDHYWFCLQVRESVSVLCIDGDESGSGAESDAFRRAVTVSSAGEGHPLFRSRFVSASKAADQVLAFYDVVAMVNPGTIPAETVKAAVEFVRHGGGLIIFLGDLVKAEVFGSLATASSQEEGEKFLPMGLGEVIDARETLGGPVRLARLDFNLPMFRPFRDPANGDPAALAAYKYRRIAFSEDAPVTTVAYFADGAPAIIEREFGRGKVVIFATTPNKRWTNFPTNPVFVTFARAMVQSCQRGRQASSLRYHFAGEIFQIITKADRFRRGARVIKPDGQPLLTRIIDSDVQRKILGRAGQESGIYKVMLEMEEEVKPGEEEGLTFKPVDSFTVNLPTSESSLSRLDANSIKESFGTSADKVHVLGLEEGWVEQVASKREGRQLGWYAFVALFGLLALEGIVAWFKKTTEGSVSATH